MISIPKILHNPNYDKTTQLFREYVGIDLSDRWFWNNYDAKLVKEKINSSQKLMNSQ